MNKIANKTIINNVFLEESAKDKNIYVLCSDSRGSAGMGPFAKERPDQFVEVGIAEQNLVAIAAGLASCGKKPWAVSPASFLSTRSMEQAKVDVAYSHTNVKLLGISGGVSYGELGMTHQSANDIATMASIPGMHVYLPSDRFQTEKLVRALLQDTEPTYIRIGRNAVEDVYEEGNVPFEFNKATTIQDGSDVTIIACGEMVQGAKVAGIALKDKGISARVIDMYCIKPIDEEAIIKAAKETKLIVTVEEHTKFGGLGSMVAQITAANAPIKVVNLGLPDEPAISGKSPAIFKHYGLDGEGIVKTVEDLIK